MASGLEQYLNEIKNKNSIKFEQAEVKTDETPVYEISPPPLFSSMVVKEPVVYEIAPPPVFSSMIVDEPIDEEPVEAEEKVEEQAEVIEEVEKVTVENIESLEQHLKGEVEVVENSEGDLSKLNRQIEEKAIETKLNKVIDPYKIEELYNKIAVGRGVIPETLINHILDEKLINKNYKEMIELYRSDFKMIGLSHLLDLMHEIIKTIARGERPDKSYLLGAPNGFGKTSFVITCLKNMIRSDMKAVPYISLTELAGLKNEYDREVMETIAPNKVYKKRPPKSLEEIQAEIGEESPVFEKIPARASKYPVYNFVDYMNADIVFCYFTSVDCKVVESSILKVLIDIRAAKGLPTIAMISSSIEPYIAEASLKEYIWRELYTVETSKIQGYDRVTHVSAYRGRPILRGETNKNNSKNEREWD